MVSFSPCECLPIFIWSFLLNVDVFNVSSVNCLHHTCLPIASRKFLTMWMSSRHFLEVTYLLCMSSKQLSLQTGGSFSLCECLPTTIWSFLLNVDGFNVSSGSCQHHVDVFQLPEGSFLTKRMSSRHLSYLLIVYVFDVVWKWPTSGRGPPFSSRMFSHYVNVSQALFEVTYLLWMSSMSSGSF